MELSRRPSGTVPTVAFIDFWQKRNAGSHSLLDRYSIHNVSFAFAFLAHKSRLIPNHLSLLSGVFALVAFGLALALPTADLPSSMVWILGFAQFAYLLDCADGQLARTTNQESDFGAFLDKGMDVVSGFLAFGGVFAFGYRHYAAQSDLDTANLVLFIGFIFLLARTARFFVWQKFVDFYREKESDISKMPRTTHHLLASLIDHQLSLAAVLLFLVSPYMAMLAFGVQALLLLAAYTRYFFRALRIEGSNI